MKARAILLYFACGVLQASSSCTFCALDDSKNPVSFFLDNLPNGTWETNAGESYTVTTPCGLSQSASCGLQADPMTQSCKGLGSLSNISMVLVDGGAGGFNLTLHGGFDDPPMPRGRNAVYMFVCDKSVPVSNPPLISNLTESPGGFYNVEWRHPAACGVVGSGACTPPPPAPPPPPPPQPCSPGSQTCLPKWNPTWGMRNSTFLYTCNNTGMHSVEAADK